MWEWSDPVFLGETAESAIEAATVAGMEVIAEEMRKAGKEGRLSITIVSSAGQPPVIQASIVPDTQPKQKMCPGCNVRPVRPGTLAILGMDGVMVETCMQCAAIERSTESIYRHTPMREHYDA